jgi:hypothetical protein
MYDVIGDIHGHADELVRLLEVLGYDRAWQGEPTLRNDHFVRVAESSVPVCP